MNEETNGTELVDAKRLKPCGDKMLMAASAEYSAGEVYLASKLLVEFFEDKFGLKVLSITGKETN